MTKASFGFGENICWRVVKKLLMNMSLQPVAKSGNVEPPSDGPDLRTGAGASLTSRSFNSTRAPKPYGPYPHAVTKGEWIFLSGQNGRDPVTSKLVEGGIRPQTERAIRNIEAILLDLGCDLSNILKTTVYLNDMREFAAMNDVYSALFARNLPARSTIQAPLPFGALVALDAIANRESLRARAFANRENTTDVGSSSSG